MADTYLNGEYGPLLSELSELAWRDLPLEGEDPLVAELEQICREFSGERKIGPDDNLFEVGVSSLTLTEIVLAIDEKHPGKVDISDLFDHPTVRDLAVFLKR
jgi:acyl carrier protein